MSLPGLVRESQSCAKTALYFIESFNVLRQDVQRFCAIARNSQVVEKCQHGLLVNKLVVKVYKCKHYFSSETVEGMG